MNDGFGLEPGVWFRLCLGGITGHTDFAGDTGVIVKPADATMVADAVVRVFIDHGDRTDRTKARLKYVLDKMGVEKFLTLMEEKLGRKLDRAVPGALAPRPPFRPHRPYRHPCAEAGGPATGSASCVPVGQLTVAQMRGLAEIARELGDGDIRLTVWQNLLISGVPTDKLEARAGAIEALGLAIEANRASAPAWSPAPAIPAASSPPPTPSAMPRRSRAGARRALHSTRRSTSISPAAIIPARSISSRYRPARPARCRTNEDGDPVEGYHVLIGGGFGPDAALGRELYRDVKAEDAPQTVERMLQGLSRASRFAARKLHRHSRAAMRSTRSRPLRAGGRMSITPRPPIPSFLPENAPFSPEQRAWLNGLFAGLFGLTEGVDAAVGQAGRAARARSSALAPAGEVDDGAPWHDPTMPIADRMKLAEGRPLPRRMMAAMAQQDCGQCGYNCKDYSRSDRSSRRKHG